MLDSNTVYLVFIYNNIWSPIWSMTRNAHLDELWKIFCYPAKSCTKEPKFYSNSKWWLKCWVGASGESLNFWNPSLFDSKTPNPFWEIYKLFSSIQAQKTTLLVVFLCLRCHIKWKSHINSENNTFCTLFFRSRSRTLERTARKVPSDVRWARASLHG